MMQPHTCHSAQLNKKYLVHIIYAGAFLLSVLTVIGYLVWNKYQAIEQNNMKKAEILVCMTRAEENYAEAWATACKKNAEKNQVALTNCISSSEKQAHFITAHDRFINYSSLYKTYTAQCKNLYGTPDSTNNCLLPKPIADGLNSGLRDEEKNCRISL